MLELKRPGLLDPADVRDITDNFDKIVAWSEQADLRLENKVDAISPNIHPFAFGFGFSQASPNTRYFKTQDNIVVALASAIKSTAIITNDLVATLPYGFRISGYARVPCAYTTSTNAAAILGWGMLLFDSDGTIKAENPPSGATALHVAAITYIGY